MLGVAEPILGARSIVGFAGLGTETGFDSATASVFMSAGSSGEHETSFVVSAVDESRGLVCAKATEVQIPSTKKATRVRGNNFFNAIGGEVPSSFRDLLTFLCFEVKGASRKQRHLSG